MFRFVPLDAFEHAGHAVLVADAEGTVRLCNGPAATLLRCDPRAALGRPCWLVARFQTWEHARFCCPDCPVQRQARAGKLEPLHRVATGRGSLLLHLELLTFLLPPALGDRHAVLHLMRPVEPPSEEPQDAIAAGRGLSCALCRLTRREMEILRLLASGLGTPEIASKLFISGITVRNHIQSILRKLQVHRRLEAVLTLLRQRS